MIKSLTSLRGIFILFIFFHHCLNLYPGGGTMAVTFFFVLGGFSMTLGYNDKVIKSDFIYKSYITKRCIKFYPLHWLSLLAVMPLTLIPFKVQQIPVFIANAALLQSWIPMQEMYFSFNKVSWYLADTMFFAIIFPLLFKWIKKGTRDRVLIATLFACFYAVFSIMLPPEKCHAILYISPYVRLADFVFGIYLALLYFKLRNTSKWRNGSLVGQTVVLGLIILLVAESCILSENIRMIAPVYWILVGAIILTASLTKPTGGGQISLLENKWMLCLGELSFIIFMIHQIVLRYATLVFNKILHFENDIINIVITLGLTILLSLMVEKYILKSITQCLKKRIQPSMTARS